MRGLPIIMLSGQTDPARQDDAIKRRVDRYLLKPTSMRDLEEIITCIIKKRSHKLLNSGEFSKNVDFCATLE